MTRGGNFGVEVVHRLAVLHARRVSLREAVQLVAAFPSKL